VQQTALLAFCPGLELDSTHNEDDIPKPVPSCPHLTMTKGCGIRRATEEFRDARMEVSFLRNWRSEQDAPMVRDEIYRIAYEANRNTVQTLDVYPVGRRLEVLAGLELRVSDDGVGMDLSVADRGRTDIWALSRRKVVRLCGGSS